MFSMYKKVSAVALLSALALVGCGNKDSNTPEDKPATLADATNPQAVKQQVEAKKTAAAPQGDKSTPLTSYVELTSGKQLLYAFQAASVLPIDYDKLAKDISKDYYRESDDFKKRDLLKALQPAIDAEIEKAKASKYYYMDMDDYPVVDKYNFDDQTFKLTPVGDAGTTRYFYDASNYQVKFPNSDQFNSLKVTDETQARAIEALRSKGNSLYLRAYFFAGDTELGETKIKAQLMKVELREKKTNKVLGEI